MQAEPPTRLPLQVCAELPRCRRLLSIQSFTRGIIPSTATTSPSETTLLSLLLQPKTLSTSLLSPGLSQARLYNLSVSPFSMSSRSVTMPQLLEAPSPCPPALPAHQALSDSLTWTRPSLCSRPLLSGQAYFSPTFTITLLPMASPGVLPPPPSAFILAC